MQPPELLSNPRPFPLFLLRAELLPSPQPAQLQSAHSLGQSAQAKRFPLSASRQSVLPPRVLSHLLSAVQRQARLSVEAQQLRRSAVVRRRSSPHPIPTNATPARLHLQPSQYCSTAPRAAPSS